ncbi:MAG: sulfatase [Phycisphaerales bacterium]|jgi:arylsulfatase A-like enzyme|nr:sulfatase [Phycisphaerales bacterium]
MLKNSSRRTFLKTLTIGAGAVALGQFAGAAKAAKSAKPNVIFIMADDHTSQAVGVYGSRLAKLNPTPNIDALAKGGMRFDNVFCNNSICTPSRASIITGQYSQTNGVLDLGGNIPPERQFLPIEMKKAGYQTAMVGKWHLKKEPGGFDYYCVLPGQGKYYNPDFRTQGDKPWPQNKITRKGMHSSDAVTDISLEWLKNGRDKNKPFFLMHHFKAPHDMFQNAKRYDQYLEDVTIPEPDNLFNPPDGSPGSRGLGSGVGKQKHAPWKLGRRLGISPDLNERQYAKACYQKYLKRYLRCVKGVDDNVKRLVDYLKETGEFENTLIMYTGDQGFFLGEHDLMDKRWMYEEAFRMPFIVHYPGTVKPASTNDWLINNTDFAPTMLEVAGAKTPKYMQGRSFAGAIRGEKKPRDWRTSTYYRYWMHLAHALKVPGHFGIRNERYKLIFFYGCNTNGSRPTPAAWEFYDLKNDPSEMKNQYANPEYKKIIADMKVELKKTRQDLNETDKKFPKIQAIIDANWDK